jgi:hypothetical protein
LSTGASSRLPLVCRLLSHRLLSRASALHDISSGSRRTHPSSTPPLCSRQLVVASHLFALPPPLDAPVPSPALLNARLQCGRPHVGRRHWRPSNDDALPPAPQDAPPPLPRQRCTPIAPRPAEGAITNNPQTPHHQRFVRWKALEGVQSPPPPSFDCYVCAASQSAIVADIERPCCH